MIMLHFYGQGYRIRLTITYDFIIITGKNSLQILPVCVCLLEANFLVKSRAHRLDTKLILLKINPIIIDEHIDSFCRVP